MANANIAENDNMAGLDTNVPIPNTLDKIGCLKNRVKIKYFSCYVYCLTTNKIFFLLKKKRKQINHWAAHSDVY